MTWLAIRLFMGKALGRLLEALRWLISHPVHFALIVAVVAAFWQYRAKEAALSDLAACEAKSAQLSAAIDAANKLAEQARAKSVTIAKEQDKAHETRSKASRASTDAFVLRNRLPTPKASDGPAAEDQATGDAENTAALPVMVAVPESDVRNGAALRDYALTCYNTGQELIREGRAD